MEKPITLTISELKNDISKLVNESKLISEPLTAK